MRSVCIVELHVTFKNITMLSDEKMLLWQFMSLEKMNCISIFM